MSSVRVTGAGKEEAELNQSDGEQVLARNTLLMVSVTNLEILSLIYRHIDIAGTIL